MAEAIAAYDASAGNGALTALLAERFETTIAAQPNPFLCGATLQDARLAP